MGIVEATAQEKGLPRKKNKISRKKGRIGKVHWLIIID